jgi:hypothetical protein
MERKKKETNNLVRFRKIGGGFFRLASGKIIKPNQVFRCDPTEIPEGFRDVVVQIDDIPASKNPQIPNEEEKKKNKVEFEIKPRGNSWFDVVDKFGKKINDMALREDAAIKMKEDLEKE